MESKLGVSDAADELLLHMCDNKRMLGLAVWTAWAWSHCPHACVTIHLSQYTIYMSCKAYSDGQTLLQSFLNETNKILPIQTNYW